jgi:zinc protease
MSWIDDKTLLIEDHTRPLITLAAVLPLSLLGDPPGKEGLTFLTTQMLTRGAGDYDRAALHEELDILGAQLGVSSSRTGTTLAGDVLSRNLDAYQALVATVLTKPRFAADEFDKLKRQTLAEIAQVRDHDDALGMRFFVRELFDDHPYGRPSMGTEETLGAITLSDVTQWYRDHFTGPVLAQAAAGDIEATRLGAFFGGTVGQLAAGVRISADVPQARPVSGHVVTLVDKPDRSQTQVFVGQPTIAASHPDYLPLLVGNTLFGGTFTARLSHEIREKRGWSYGVSSSLGADRNIGTFTMRFFPANDQTVPAVRLADAMLQSLVSAGGSLIEVEAAKRYLIQSHPLGIETPERELHQRLGLRLLGRDDDWLERFVDEIRAVTPEAVSAALRTHLDPDRMLTTIVCTASGLAEELEAWDRPTVTRVVAYDSL